MKLIIPATAVQALIASAPDAVDTLELAKNAAAQVASELANRITKEVVQGKIDSFLNAEMAPYSTRGMSDRAAAVLKKAIEKECADFIEKLSNGDLKKEIHKLAVEETNTQLAVMRRRADAYEKEFETKIDALIRERFAKAFSLPS